MPSTKILIGAAIVGAVGYFSYDRITNAMIMNEKFAPLAPSAVNIVGVDTSKGYYILVANQMAQLVLGEFTGEFAAPDKSESGDSDKKRRIPIREMLASLNGDVNALGQFVMKMNDISDAELPAFPTVWTSEKLQQALDGDAQLVKKLEQDLNQKLDGTPLETVKVNAIQEGIVIDSPVEVLVPVGGKPTKLVARVREEYRSRFMSELDKTLAEKRDFNADLIRGYYMDAARKLLENPGSRENIRASLEGLLAEKRLKVMADLPERILNSITIIVNDDLMESAASRKYDSSDGKSLHDLTVRVNDEGRRRMWQYSKMHTGTQILLVWDGIAVAAPKISHEIPFAEVTISKLPDPTLVNDTVEAINRIANDRKTKV